MTWTTGKPIHPGWYWYYCHDEGPEPVIAWVVMDLDTRVLAVFFAGQDVAEDLADLNHAAQWAGPIRPPERTEQPS